MIVTSFSPQGFEQYGRTFIETFLTHWKDEELVCYVEDDNPEFEAYAETGRVSFRYLMDVRGMTETLDSILDSDPIYRGKMLIGDQRIYNFRYDAYRFSRKIFSIYDAYRNIPMPDAAELAWVDADVVFTEDVPEGFLRSQLQGAAIAYLGRDATYTEAGFMVFDLLNRELDEFMRLYHNTYTTGAFRYLGEWHDCYVFDFARLASRLPTTNLAADLEPKQLNHPFVYAEIGKYADHLKGPERKEVGFSPERNKELSDAKHG